MDVNRVTEDARRNVGFGSFIKVYAENDKVIGDSAAATRMSATIKKAAPHTTATDSKGTRENMEKIKGKHSNPANQNLRRKALADVSNVQSGVLRDVPCDGSKPKNSLGLCSRTVNLSSKSLLMGKMRNKSSQRVGDFQTARKGVKELKSSSDVQKGIIKNPGPESDVTNPRSRVRKSIVPIRKSLPVFTRMNHADTINTKGSNESSEKSERISGFPVKAKVRKKAPLQVSTGRSYLWRTRVSNGFIIMAPNDQTGVDAHVPTRKSIRPMIKTAIKASNAHGMSKSKRASVKDKSLPIATTSSQKEEEALKSSFSVNIPVVVACEATQAEPSFDCISKSGTNKSDVAAHGKSNRRRSFTSSLVARSKLLGACDDQLEKLPSIDDLSNQLEVAEYINEIYQFYWVSEAHNLSLANYMSIQTEITPKMRGILINWLIEVHYKFELMQETLYLMVTLLDRYLSYVQIKKNEMQLVGLTALLLASKYEDFWHPRIKDLISIAAESYTRNQMLAMEKLILKRLKFRLNEPTSYVFMLRFLKAAQSDLNGSGIFHKLRHLSFYLIELCLVEYEALKFKPSMLCASAIYVARCTLQITPPWTRLLAKHSCYEVSEIRDCAKMILRFQKAASTTQLKVTYEKYMGPELSGVAAIKPIHRLPF